MLTDSPLWTSVTPRPSICSAMPRLIWSLKRRMKRWRFTVLRFLPHCRRSIRCGIRWRSEFPPGSTGLAHPEVPLGEQAHLLLRIALPDHARDEVLVLLLILLRSLGVEGDHRQQVLGGREHLVLDHGAQLLVAGPHRVAALVGGARTQHEVHDLVAEVLRVADP